MGGAGSGRKPDPLKQFTPKHTGIATINNVNLDLPNYSGVRKFIDTHDVIDFPAETDPIFSSWLATPPNVSTFTNDSAYLIASDITGKADVELDNLSNVAINTDLVSDTNNTDSLGTSTKGWKDLQLRNQAFVGGVTSTATISDIGTSLMAHYLLNDNAANTTVLDNKGSFNATLLGGDNTSAKSEAGKINQAFHLNGTDDSVYYATLPSYSPITVSVWCNFDNTATSLLISKYNGTWSFGNIDWYMALNKATNGYVALGYGTGSSYVQVSQTDGGAGTGWHMWTFTATDNGNLILYKDGVYMNQIAIGGALKQVGNNKLYIGTLYPGYVYTDGAIDDVRIYNKVLTPAEILALYNQGNGTESESTTFTIGASHQVVATTANYSSSHSLDTLKDLAIEGELEVDQNVYIDGELNVDTINTANGTAQIDLSTGTIYLNDGTTAMINWSNTGVVINENGSNLVYLGDDFNGFAISTYGLCFFTEGTTAVYLCDGSYGVNADYINTSVEYWCQDTQGYTGDLNDSTSTKIADVVGGIITAVYF